MIQRQLKLRPTKAQERELERWLYHLAAVWNWAIRKIELDARDSVYYSEKQFHNLLAGHSTTLGIPAHVLQGTLSTAWHSWRRCFKHLAGKPRFKSRRNKLNSILFPDPVKPPKGNRITLLGVRAIRFYKQPLPEGRIKRESRLKSYMNDRRIKY